MHLIRAAAAAAAFAMLALAGAHAQPGGEPIRIVSPYPAGAIGDAIARMLAEHMRTSLARPVIVENKPGAAGRLGVQFVKSAPPNGDVLLFVPIAPMVMFPHVYDRLGYDAVADFAPISQIATFDLSVAVGASVPVKSLKELVGWLRAHPTQATFGTPAAGSLPHFFAVLFSSAAGLDLRHVAYKGNPQAISDLIGGHLPIFFTSSQDLVETHKAGRIRVLATSGKERSSVLPDVPTFAEAGYAIRGNGWYGMYAPAKTPPEVVAQLNAVVVGALSKPEMRSRLAAVGLVPTGTSPSELSAIQKADMDFWGPIVKASGFKPE
jgi:tripartite-type tricarboxylate transporter receptor subunit TctC